jgi:hypothetical protein
MAVDVDNDLWLQSHRIGLAKGRIAALDDIRLRLIEMADVAAANALAGLVDRLRKDLDYQNQVMVAMQARAAVTRIEQMTGVDTLSAQSGTDYEAPVAWRDLAPSAPSAHQAAEAV